ncbi:putative membrane protein [Corynebacterium capitovis DSM 44611]|uniref:septum formation family protein n=1 Tax=Corynebacterium capitovis TaxID=131081 RepID=UPI000399F54E|nr:septum formation family protein [Corynebacterium capitovis]WKD58298.1 putative membrane protein [Corynebacterium capitovis DSM 44611]
MVSPTTGIRSVLLAALAGAVGTASFSAFSGAQHGDGATVASSGATAAHGVQPAAPFTTADQGSCLTWQVGGDGSIFGFEQAGCDSEHRFEVSAREDLATFPSSEFGPDAEAPNSTRQAQLREELCGAATLRYLNGVYDQAGRYSIASILPPADAWARGDRTMLCGLQVTDSSGSPTLTTGTVASQDQARVLNPGQCATADAANTVAAVDCAQPHQLEITSTVNLAPVFADHTPSVEEQDKYLGDICTTAAQDYLGGENNLYLVALQPFWTTLPAARWDGGSRSVNCALVYSDGGSFATLTGSATSGRDVLRIDGNPPPERPERRPLRDQAATASATATPVPAPTP